MINKKVLKSISINVYKYMKFFLYILINFFFIEDYLSYTYSNYKQLFHQNSHYAKCYSNLYVNCINDDDFEFYYNWAHNRLLYFISFNKNHFF